MQSGQIGFVLSRSRDSVSPPAVYLPSSDDVLLEKSLRRAPAGGLKDFKGGQFITAALWESEKEAAKSALSPLLADFDDEMQFLRAVYVQNSQIARVPGAAAALAKVDVVPLSTVEARIKKNIRNYYSQAFLLGKRSAGNLMAISPDDLALLAKLRKDEYSYLRKFLATMREGSGVLPYDIRMRWYSQAAREVYYLGFLFGNPSADRWIKWRVGPTEHCDTCLKCMGTWRADKLAAHVRKTGEIPKSGRLDCRGYHCGCSLEEATKPAEGEEHA